MDRILKFLNPMRERIGNAMPKLTFLSGVGASLKSIALEIFIGVVASRLLYSGGIYLPWWGTPAILAITAPLAGVVLWRLEMLRYLPSVFVYAGLTLLSYAFTQPIVLFWAAGALGLIAAAATVKWRKPQRFKFGAWARVLLLAAVAALVVFATVALLALLMSVLLSSIGDFAIHNRILLPPLSVLVMMTLIFYCWRRQPVGTPSLYYLSVPVLGSLWTFYWWPTNASLDGVAMVAVTMVLSVIAFFTRPFPGVHSKILAVLPRFGRKSAQAGKRSVVSRLFAPVGGYVSRHLLLVGSFSATASFLVVFTFANTNVWWQQYAAATVMVTENSTVTPTTVGLDLSVVPENAALDYLEGSNWANFTDLGKPYKVLVSHNGKTIAAWVALSHPQQIPFLGWVFHPLKATGGCGQLGIVDAGSMERTGWVDPVEFVLCDQSPLLKSAAVARHWGSVIHEPIPAQDRYGEWHLLFAVTTTRMHLFTMLEVPTDVLTVSPDGAMRSLFLSTARREFPGAAVLPQELALRYLSTWAQDRDLLAKYAAASDGLFEISEDRKPGAPSVYPLWQPFGTDPHLEGVVPLEPLGAQHNANVVNVYFDAFALKARIVDVRAQGLVGPRFIVLNTAQSGGNAKFGPYTGSRLVPVAQAVGTDGLVNWVFAMELPPETRPLYHGYAGDVATAGQGGGTPDIVSTGADVDRWLKEQHSKP